MSEEAVRYYATGRRKNATARVWLKPGTGQILVNGRPLIRERGYLTSYRDLTLTEAQRALFRPGVNTLAVSCRQTGGGQGIDLGLTLSRSE